MFSTYLTAFDPSRIGWQERSPSEFTHRSIGRPHSERNVEGEEIRIEWPWSKHGRIKNVISRSGSRRRYSVPCFRGGDREAHCEAEEEALTVVLLDACSGIEFQEQPARILFIWMGQLVEHYPDLLVVYDGYREFWECKRDHEAFDLLIRRRTERVSELLQPLGFGYRLVTRGQLEALSFYENAVRMRRRTKFVQDFPDTLPPLPFLPPESSHVIAGEHLCSLPSDYRLDALYSLLYDGRLAADLSNPIALDMYVGPARSERGELPWVLELFKNIK